MANKPKVTVFISDATLGAQAFLDTSRLPELTMIADIETTFINTRQAAEINLAIWEKLSNAIYQKRNKSDGFVIIHGTDGILYTSAAMSFLLNGLTKPIIFTGTIPENNMDKDMEMRANIINAIQAATYRCSEVGLVFGNKFLRAIKTEYGQDRQLNFFEAPPEATLGKIDFSIRVFEKMFHNKSVYKNKPPLTLNKDIVALRLSPILSAQQLRLIINKQQGCIIDVSDYNSLPEKIAEEINNQSHEKTIVLWSKQPGFAPNVSSRVVVINCWLTWHAAIAKLVWACSISKSTTQTGVLIRKRLDHELL